jgi:phage tail sheath protein FI
MAEILSPGVFIEEVPAQLQVIQAVSTSNLGIVGFTQRGPSNTATLVTSFDQFTRVFGDFTRESFLPLSVAAFFSNGGRRAYVVRVVPADAVEADAKIRSKTTDQKIEEGDGAAVAFTKTAATSELKDNEGASPLVSSSVSIRYRGLAAVVPLQDLRNRANGADLAQVIAQASYEGRVNPASLVGAYTAGVLLDSAQFALVPATFTLSWDPDGGGARTIVVPLGTTPFKRVTTAANGQGSVMTLDLITGFLSIKFAGTDIPVGAFVGDIQASFTPTGTTRTVVDDGAGALTGVSLAAPGTISYADGSYSFTTLGTIGNLAHNKAPFLVTYSINAWNLDPISKGVWANEMKVEITGDQDFLDTPNATFSRFNLNVLLRNSSSGLFETLETYEELDFATATSADFFADVINELSDLIRVQEPGGDEAPGELQGIARTQIFAGGNELAANQTIAATLLNGPIAPRSVSITYYRASDNTLRTITDNGSGVLVGHVDGTFTNTINYTTGAVSFKTLETIRGATLVTASYRSAASETTHSEQFGDTTKGYTAGTDGTFDSTNFGRSQFTAPGTLQTNYQGVYALDRVEEIMQVAIPDFAGDEIITGDLLDYADSRAGLPSGGDRFILLAVPRGSSAQEAVDWFRFTLGRFSKFAALYWPWVKVADPLANNRPLTMPPLGHIAGIYARTDATKNVGKSPGGTVDGALRFLTGLELDSTQGERDVVYPNKINPLISGPQTGLAVWGVRTIASESEWRYINARRLFMFLERSIYNATAWIVFENNGPALWGRIKAQLSGFLTALHGEGYFAGTTPAESFFVVVDDSNNSPESIELGQVIIDVGIAPNKPAEFVRFRFQQISLT